jgi:D-serine deaminase-like pyridoxal phosphate-dependent protein
VKRRTFLYGGGIAAAAATGGVYLWKPRDQGAPHDAYFSALNELLKRDGPGRPVMILDLDRVNRNIDVLAASVGPDKTYRVVVKSLPSVPLLAHVMQRANTNALMVFHQPFLNAIANAFPECDALIGKPMPVAAAREFYRSLRPGTGAVGGSTTFNPARQVQWLIDSRERLNQYQALARELGVTMRLNVELDVGLHRGGIEAPEAIDGLLAAIASDPDHLRLSGLMGYEPHLTGLAAGLDHPAVRRVLGVYRGFIDRLRQADIDPATLTLNGAGSHTLRIYEGDHTMNDLAAGSGVVKPTDFDTYHLSDNSPAMFIATPVLKRYDDLRIPGDPWIADVLEWWNPNQRRLHFAYGGYWKARYVSPTGIPEPLYHSTNQEPFTTSTSVELAVDDYVFLRPTQSERVMLQFGDLLTVQDGELVEAWPVFHETG